MLSRATAAALQAWVHAGGRLISEGCPGYFDDRGHVDPRQPGLGLDELLGARERYVEFTPDLLEGLTFQVGDTTAPGGVVLQAFEPTTGTAVGYYADGHVAAIDNLFGRGRTRLIGTLAGVGHHRRPGSGSRTFFADLLRWAEVRPFVRVGKPGVVARAPSDPAGESFLWVINHNRAQVDLDLELSPELGLVDALQVYWGEAIPSVHGRQVRVQLGGRDALVAGLRRAGTTHATSNPDASREMPSANATAGPNRNSP